MSKVFVTTYEVIGDLDLLNLHYAADEAAVAAHWAYVEGIGASGFRPSQAGGVASVFFETLPQGWRKIGADKGRIEAVPLKSTKVGKAAAATIADLPRKPKASALAASYGYNPPLCAMDGTYIYFPSEIQVLHPVKRTFLRLPRFPEDGFEPDETRLRAVPESELMAAIEAHNAEVNRLREGGAA
ncbi:hypothetical protein [Novosphingobium huizhouense]|uniref:hypothetical protein n=1 Tax=Novosphingobium huizhouense TaxID=2866625 RepID=UPI001CD8E464|nr:hypothetical protein [Novosphingobium huizhouense]